LPANCPNGQLRIALSAPLPVLEDAGARIVRYAQKLALTPPCA